MIFLLVLSLLNLFLSLAILVVCSNQNKECIDVKNLEDKVSDISSMLEDWIY